MSRPVRTVTSLATRAAYSPDRAGIAAAQVRAAREKLGMDHEEFAGYLSTALPWEVMAGWLARWEAGDGTPPADVYIACAEAAQDVLMSAAAVAAGHDGSEDVTPYADRGLIGREQWRAIIRGSREQIWLYGMAEHGYAADDEVPLIMAEAAEAGCAVRVLLLSPAYPGITDIEAAEGSPPGTLAARIREATAKFRRMQAACSGRMELRAYGTYPTVSVVRGDDEMLITPYLRFHEGDNSPTLGITARSAPRMFGRYARHFSSMWDIATDIAREAA